jgi:hypothetical protein
MIQALKRIQVRVCQRAVIIEAGGVIDIPDDKAHKLLRLAGRLVRLVEENPYGFLSPGHLVEWNSLLFGLLQGRVLEVKADHIDVHHPLTTVRATIPKSWFTNLHPEVENIPASVVNGLGSSDCFEMRISHESLLRGLISER